MNKISRELLVINNAYDIQSLSDGDLMEDIWDVCNSYNLSDKGVFKVQIIYQEVEDEQI